MIATYNKVRTYYPCVQLTLQNTIPASKNLYLRTYVVSLHGASRREEEEVRVFIRNGSENISSCHSLHLANSTNDVRRD